LTATTATGPGTTTGTGTTATGTAFAQDFDSFLKLLTAQLQNQDPLAPMDADKFTSQLVQFSGVEQAINTNAKLDSLIGMSSAGLAGAGLQYVGAEVEVDGSEVTLDAGGADLRYSLAAPAATVQISLYDQSGKLVQQMSGPGAAGGNEAHWDGLIAPALRAPAGTYRANVVAKDAAGQPVAASQARRGTVDAAEVRNGTLLLDIAGTEVPADTVRIVGRPSS
jgi:flagellar basal-body rod modification protein FlgD